MSLIVTPGAANADTMADVDAFDAYCTARGVTNDFMVAAKEAALRVGAQYLANQYRDKWIGRRANETQSMPWPRLDGTRGYGCPLTDADGFDIAVDAIPAQIRDANIAAALLHLQGVTLEPTRLERGGQIKSIGKGVGPLRKDVTYMDGAPAVDRFVAIEGMLRGLVTGSPGATSGNIRLVRA